MHDVRQARSALAEKLEAVSQDEVEMMGIGNIEQICSRAKRAAKYRKLLKLYLHRRERRRAKRDPEVKAGYRRFQGWEY